MINIIKLAALSKEEFKNIKKSKTNFPNHIRLYFLKSFWLIRRTPTKKNSKEIFVSYQ